MTGSDAEFRPFVEARCGDLLRLAYALTGSRPQPDPYGRVPARHRRSRRRRAAVVAAAVSAALLGGAVGFAAIRPAGVPPTERHAPPRTAIDNVNAWAHKLALAPSRGAVAADPAFVTDLADRMMRNWRDGWYDANRLSVGEVRVPYADDVGPYRMALIVCPDRAGRAQPPARQRVGDRSGRDERRRPRGRGEIGAERSRSLRHRPPLRLGRRARHHRAGAAGVPDRHLVAAGAAAMARRTDRVDHHPRGGSDRAGVVAGRL